MIIWKYFGLSGDPPKPWDKPQISTEEDLNETHGKQEIINFVDTPINPKA